MLSRALNFYLKNCLQYDSCVEVYCVVVVGDGGGGGAVVVEVMVMVVLWW
jgi:acetyl-CoA carboxylase alpha subunit